MVAGTKRRLHSFQDVRLYLKDILDSIQRIESYAPDAEAFRTQ
jgi:uncharacterized protein with HEPN domain